MTLAIIASVTGGASVMKKFWRQSGIEHRLCYANGLILDLKTRWDSLVAMLERFLELNSYILKAMIGLKEILNISEEEYAVTNATTILLQPIKVGIERLGRSDAALLDAEGVLIFILDDLWEKNIFFTNKLLQSVQQRIEERRNINYVGSLKF